MKTQHITLSNNDQLSMISTFSTLINAGIPILETVDSLLEDSKGNTKKILESTRDDLVQGKPLHLCFSKFPEVFGKVTINIIKASEEAGTLDVVLKDLKNQVQKDMEFIDKIKSALMYPLIIFVVFLGVLLLILVVVIPKIAVVFSQLKVELPLPTKILIFASNTILHNTLVLLIGLLATGAGIYFLFKFQKKIVLRFLYSFPIISTIVKEIDLTRFFRSMYLLLSSGIIITSALQLAEEVVMRKDIAKSIAYTQESVLAGRRLSDAFKENRKIFSGIMIRIIEAGEKTGTLDKSMQDMSDYMDYQVSNMLKTLTSLLEPFMLVFMAALVGGMMLSIIAPIYGLISQVGGK
ncbi:MAG: type II secretion system F family protein [Patescibacteria group bacterium]|mgnify:CR=1 FL=1